MLDGGRGTTFVSSFEADLVGPESVLVKLAEGGLAGAAISTAWTRRGLISGKLTAATIPSRFSLHQPGPLCRYEWRDDKGCSC